MGGECVFKAAQTPGAKYNINLELTRPKSAAATICPQQRITGKMMKDARMQPLKKDKDKPDMCTYKAVESEEKTQTKRKDFTFGKLTKTSFVDDSIKKKKFMPSVGRYTNLDKAYSKIAPMPKSICRKRS